jgi:predicted transcriptional regulator
MDNTSRVAQWRQRMRDEGKEALTVWLSHDAKLRLEDLAATWHTTTSEMIEQALAHFHPGSPPRIGNETDTAQLQALMQETVRAMLPGLKEAMLQELRGEKPVAPTNGNVTVTEAIETTPSEACPPFDPTKAVLGKLCRGGHEWGTTGKTLRRLPSQGCGQCESERKRRQRKEKHQSVPQAE